jgi:hypothetical protein
MTADIGLASFEQFVFLQHFVLTFDERRQLLFWEPRILNQALYLAFNVDHNDTRRAEQLRREVDKADSLVRNYNWQASDARKKLEELRETTGQSTPSTQDPTKIHAQHVSLQKDLQQASVAVSEYETQLRDAHLKITELSARHVALRSKYTDQFARRVQKRAHVEQHPLIRASIRDAACGLCGAQGDNISKAVEKAAQSNQCCICGSNIARAPVPANNLKELQKIDEELGSVRSSLGDFAEKADRVNKAIVSARERSAKAAKKLEDFEEENSAAITRSAADSRGDTLSVVLTSLQMRQQDALAKKAAALEKRNDKKHELKKLEDKLERQYDGAESVFVPAFKDLSHEFLA